MESAASLQSGVGWWRGRLLRLRAVEELMLERLLLSRVFAGALAPRFARAVAYRRAESRQQLHVHSWLCVLGSFELVSQCKP